MGTGDNKQQLKQSMEAVMHPFRLNQPIRLTTAFSKIPSTTLNNITIQGIWASILLAHPMISNNVRCTLYIHGVKFWGTLGGAITLIPGPQKVNGARGGGIDDYHYNMQYYDVGTQTSRPYLEYTWPDSEQSGAWFNPGNAQDVAWTICLCQALELPPGTTPVSTAFMYVDVTIMANAGIAIGPSGLSTYEDCIAYAEELTGVVAKPFTPEDITPNSVKFNRKRAYEEQEKMQKIARIKALNMPVLDES